MSTVSHSTAVPCAQVTPLVERTPMQVEAASTPLSRPPQPPQEDPPSARVSVSSTVAMSFEFNASTQAMMLLVTDARSGEVVRKINLKGIFNAMDGQVHASGQWIDKAA